MSLSLKTLCYHSTKNPSICVQCRSKVDGLKFRQAFYNSGWDMPKEDAPDFSCPFQKPWDYQVIIKEETRKPLPIAEIDPSFDPQQERRRLRSSCCSPPPSKID
jgi:hypothetical protein